MTRRVVEVLGLVNMRMGNAEGPQSGSLAESFGTYILLIPGTSKVAHLRENVAGVGLSLAAEDLAELDGIGG